MLAQTLRSIAPSNAFFVFHQISFGLQILQFVYATYVKRCNTPMGKQLLNALANRSRR